MSTDIRLLGTDAELHAAWPVMAQLRPAYDADSFVAQVRRQMTGGYRLAGCFRKDAPLSLAGYRYGENLHAGRYMYVDDLVTDEQARGSGAGKALFEWLMAEAKRNGCVHLSLDSGVQRFAAHRFYLDRGMIISAHHFALTLE
ncbi:MAG TPA: GNAT family N-acetyltransferase [Gammaproteobacteria bacterium]